MNYIKFLLIISLSMFLFSCGGIDSAFSNKKKNNNDEFLVEKKSPLIMPPDYNELPIPSSSEIQANDMDNVKNLIISQKNDNEKNKNNNSSDSDLEEMLLEKIKNN